MLSRELFLGSGTPTVPQIGQPPQSTLGSKLGMILPLGLAAVGLFEFSKGHKFVGLVGLAGALVEFERQQGTAS